MILNMILKTFSKWLYLYRDYNNCVWINDTINDMRIYEVV